MKQTRWLPQEESNTYTLLEFKNVLITMTQERLQILKKLPQYRAVILDMVLQFSFWDKNKKNKSNQRLLTWTEKKDIMYIGTNTIRK